MAAEAACCASLSAAFSLTTILTVSPLASFAMVSSVLLSRDTAPPDVLTTRSALVSLTMVSTVAFGISSSVDLAVAAASLLAAAEETVISIVSDLLETACATSFSAVSYTTQQYAKVLNTEVEKDFEMLERILS